MSAPTHIGHAPSPAAVYVTAAGVAGIAAAAYVLSFDAMRAVAEAAGIDPGLAWLYPVTIDGLMTLATAAAVVMRHRDWPPRAYAWSVLSAMLAWSVLCNSLHATADGGVLALSPEVAMAVSGMPALALGLAVHLGVVMLRHPDTTPATIPDTASDTTPEATPDTTPAAVPDTTATARHLRPVPARTPRRRHVTAQTTPDTTPDTDTTRTTDTDRRAEVARVAAELRAAGHRVSGAAIGRRLGLSARQGQRLLATAEA